MVKVFLDANYFIDVVESRRNVDKKGLIKKQIYISLLSLSILSYLYKYTLPNKKFEKIFNKFINVDLSNEIAQRSLIGPTDDFEDNIQLHSAADSECDYFLTSDKNLLNMKFFGKVKIVNQITT